VRYRAIGLVAYVVLSESRRTGRRWSPFRSARDQLIRWETTDAWCRLPV